MAGKKTNRGRPTKYDPSYPDKAYEILSQGHSVTGLAGALGVPRSRIYEWADAHPEFQDALKAGQAMAAFHWEKTLKAVAERGEGNASAAIFAVKNRVSDEWLDKVQNEHTGKDGGPVKTESTVTIDPSVMDRHTLETLMAAKRGDQSGGESA
jgi:hypothetical protein